METVAPSTIDTVSQPPLFVTPEPAPEISAPAENSPAEKIKRIGKSIFEKHGVLFKRGPGRQRKDGMPNKSAIPLTAPATALPGALAAPAPVPAQPSLDPVLVKRCCSAVIKALTGFADKLLFNKAKAATNDAGFAQRLVADTTITSPEIDAFSELAEICLRKYGVGTEYAPEIGLGAIVAGVALRYTAALRGLPEPQPQKPEGK